MWCVAAEMVCSPAGSKTTRSASEPTAMVPLRGKRPNILAAAQLLLLLHAEGAVVGGDDLQVVGLQALPQLVLIPLLAERRRHHVLRALDAVAVVFDGEEEVLRAGLGEGGQAAVARLAHLVQGVGAGEVDDVDG